MSTLDIEKKEVKSKKMLGKFLSESRIKYLSSIQRCFGVHHSFLAAIFYLYLGTLNTDNYIELAEKIDDSHHDFPLMEQDPTLGLAC